MILRCRHIFFLALSMLLSACANQVAPTGGPKDNVPPKVVKAEPDNGSVGVFTRKVEITFDEYITLNNAKQEMLVSPPPHTKPDVKLRNNKTVVVSFKEPLLPDATYTIHFGEAVKDFHEGNLFKDYVYTFSTGLQIDTLSISGTIVNADDEKPADDMLVTLYAETDSLFSQPLLRAPDFITKTDKEGKFRFDGLPDKRFLLFALSDVNSNLYFDMPNEKVAFLDNLVSPSDTLELILKAFTEEDTTQMLLEKKLAEEGLLRFAFRHPADKVQFSFSEPTVDTFQMVKVWSKEIDTLRCYFTPNVMDSLWVTVRYDTLINDSTRYSLKYREPVKTAKTPNDKVMKVGSNLRGKLLLPDQDFTLCFPEPVIKAIPYDTLHFVKADDYGMEYRLVLDIDDKTDYKVNLPDSIFFSVRGRTNDSLSFQFGRAKETDYGNLFIQVEPPQGRQVVVELINGRGKAVEQRILDTPQKLSFIQLAPEKYKLRAIIDADRNGKWSTGNFHRRFFPETVVPYKDELDVKAGWDIDLDEVWKIR